MRFTNTHLFATTATVCAIATASPAQAQEKSFNVPAQPAVSGIPEFARQADIQILASESTTRTRRTNAVRGAMSIQSGLRMLLRNTGLGFSSNDGTTFIVSPRRTAAASRSSASASQDPEPPATRSPDQPQRSQAGQSGDIVVTGSRLPQPNLRAISPITTVTGEDFVQRGTIRVEDVINSLPQAFANQGSTVSNGALGVASVNLRGLGTGRTLVLIDGRRLGDGDPLSPMPDLNFIPAALVERVEIVTGGASAVYGADAVAGVVNFIMQKDFSGIRVDALYSGYLHHNDSFVADIVRARQATAPPFYPLPDNNVADGGSFDFSAVIGANTADDRGNVTLYATYRRTSEIQQNQRDYSSCSLTEADTTFVCGGSGTSVPTRFLSADRIAAGLPGDLVTTGTGFRARTANDVFNSTALDSFQRSDERYTVGGYGTYEFAPSARAFLQVMYMNDRTVAALRPVGIFGLTYGIPCSNPLLTAQQVDIICTQAGLTAADSATGSVFRRNVEGGRNEPDLSHAALRIVLGLAGEIDDVWSYEVYGLRHHTDYSFIRRGEFSQSRIRRALDVVADPVTGRAVCRSVLDGSDSNCVPYDAFGAAGPSEAAIEYLSLDATASGFLTQHIFSGQLTGELERYGLRSPWAASGVSVALGAEYRRERLSLQFDESIRTGDVGFSLSDQQGKYDLAEFFGEIRIPIVTDRPLFDDLTLEGGYRYSHYSNSGSTNTYKVGLSWRPHSIARLRTSFNRAVRAPSILELFEPFDIGNNLGDDPCAGPSPAFTVAQCENTGLPARLYGVVPTASVYQALQGGNPDLRPETAETFSLGIQIGPEGLAGLTLSIDYFDIKISDTIESLSPDLVLQNCGITGSTDLCALVQRDPINGSLFTGNSFVEGRNTNIGGVRTSGIDVDASWVLPRSSPLARRIGGLSARFYGTLLDRLETRPGLPAPTDIDTNSYDCAGLYGSAFCRTPKHKWRHRFSLTWMPAAQLSLTSTWRFYGSVLNQNAGSDNPYFDITPTPAVDLRIPAQSYFDLALQWDINRSITARVGANNIFDRNPPVIGTRLGGADPLYAGNTFPVVYDSLGRYVFASITVRR